jgi:hypothetical protein
MYVLPMPRVHLILAAVAALYLPSMWPEEEEKSEKIVPTREKRTYVVDAETKVIHRPDCPAARELPDERKAKTRSPYGALNSGCTPCEECRPMVGIK